MRFARDQASRHSVRRIEPGTVVIGDRTFTGNIALTPDAVIEDCPDRPLAALNEAAIAAVLDTAPEVLLIGTGWRAAFAPRELTHALARRGIGLEVMDTPAACRTFNILIAEDRLPAALLYLDDA